MTDYRAMIEEHSCKPNQGCGVMTICMCGVAEDMAGEIERLRAACENASSYISVRDQFAMAALTGMLMRSVGYEETAEKAYKFADAMIKTRAALREKE